MHSTILHNDRMQKQYFLKDTMSSCIKHNNFYKVTPKGMIIPFCGTVIRGTQRAAHIGFPTANVEIHDALLED